MTIREKAAMMKLDSSKMASTSFVTMPFKILMINSFTLVSSSF